MRQHWLARLAAAAATTGAALAGPPTVAFLTPSSPTPGRGESIKVRFAVGAAKDAQIAAWPADVDWLFIRGGPTQENRHAVRPQRAADNFVEVKIEHPGVTLIGADLESATLEMTGAELRAFITENCAAPSAADAEVRGTAETKGEALAQPALALPVDRKLRIRHVMSAKTLVRVASADGKTEPSAIATSKCGQVVEMRPLVDPTALAAGSDLPLWTYINADKKGGVKVRATHPASGKVSTFVTDAGGSGHFRLSDAGAWRVECHHAEPAADKTGADWVIYSATLTFEVAKGVGQ